MAQNGKLKDGIIWSFAGSYGNKLVSTFVFFLLAKLLGAESFGLIAISNAIISIGDIIIEQGMISAIVQKDNPKPSFINTAFWVNFILGVTIFGIFLLGAPVIAHVYKEPRLADILRIASLVYLIGPCGIVQTAILTKQMNFRAITISRTVGLAVAGITAVGLAFWGLGAWSLVVQQLVFVIVSTTLLWRQSEWRPSLFFAKDSFFEIFSFSSKILGNNFINYFNNNSTELTIGIFLNAQSVGLYLFAYKIFHTTLIVANTSINQVMLPLFSSVQHDDITLRKYFLKAINTAYFLLIPILVFVIFIIPTIIEKLFNASWHKAISLIPLICFAGIINMICYYANSLLISKNRLNLLIKINVINAILNILFVYFAAQVSLEFIGISQIFKNLIILPVSYYFLSKVLFVSLRDIGSNLLNQLFIGIFLTIVMYSLSYITIFNDLNPYLFIVCKCFVFSLTLFISINLFAPEIIKSIKDKIVKVYKSKSVEVAARS